MAVAMIRTVGVSAVCGLLALAAGCKASEFAGEAPTAAKVAPKSSDANDGGDGDDLSDTDKRDNELTEGQDDGSDGKVGDLADACMEKNGTFVAGEGCYVCQDDRQTYDADLKKCEPELGTDANTGKVVGGVFTILDGVFKNLPKDGIDTDDDDIGGPFGPGGGGGCGC